MNPEDNQGDEVSLHGEVILDLIDNRPLSERDALIIEMYEEGLSTYEIAELLEINRHTVSKVLRDNNKQTRTIADYHKLKHEDIIEMYKRGITNKHEIAKKTGLTYYTVRKVLEDSGLILNKRDRETISIAQYVQLKNKGHDNDSIAKILFGKFGTEKQLNKLIRNSGVNVSSVREKTKDLGVLQDIVRKGIEGVSAKQISLKYGIEIVLVREILYEFGLCRKCGNQI